MTILVTGGTGFIGSHLINALLANGKKVRILTRRKSNINKLKKMNLEFAFGNLDDIDSLRKATEDIEIVYHLAAMLGSPGVTYKQLYNVNVKGTENLVMACEESKVKRFVLVSSVAAMGPVGYMADEKAECNPATDYDKTKYLSEIVVKKSKLKWVIIRPTMVYGPGETKNKLRMFRLIQRGLFFIMGDGKNLMSLVYVGNLIEGIIKAGENKNAVKQTYIISDKKPYSMNEFVKTIARNENVKTSIHLPVFVAYIGAFLFKVLSIFGIPQLLSKDRIKNLTMNHSFDISKVMKELDYNPKMTLDEGVKRTVSWYKEEGMLK